MARGLWQTEVFRFGDGNTRVTLTARPHDDQPCCVSSRVRKHGKAPAETPPTAIVSLSLPRGAPPALALDGLMASTPRQCRLTVSLFVTSAAMAFSTTPAFGAMPAPAASTQPQPMQPPQAPQVKSTNPEIRKQGHDAHGAGIWIFGAERSVWRPMAAEPSQGYDGLLHLAWLGQNGHFIGSRVALLALGGSTAGVEARLQSTMTLGAGIYTFGRGLAYARLGYDLRVAGNARARSSLLAPVLEVGHFWTDTTKAFDAGLRFDVPALGNFGVNAANSRYFRDLDLSGYAMARYRLVLADFSLGQRRLKVDHLAVWRFEGSVCGGAYVVLCSRFVDYWLPDAQRHVTEVTFVAGYGAISAW